jgi:hypothetical protein
MAGLEIIQGLAKWLGLGEKTLELACSTGITE